jgi:hypothetical protein
MANTAPKSGPTAKQRPDDRLGHRTKAEQAQATTLNVKQEEPPPVIPKPNPTWDAVPLGFWNAFITSPVREMYESTDYQTCYYLCDLIQDSYRTGFRPGQLMVIRQLMVDLLFTETARRAANILVARTPEVLNPSRVAAIEAARSRRQ